MKARYVVISCLMSLVINVISIYNFRLAFVSLFFLLISFIPALYEKIYERFTTIKKSEQSLMAKIVSSYFAQRSTRIVNKFAMIFGLIIIFFMSVGAMWLQLNDTKDTVALVSANINIDPLIAIAPTLSKVGWIIFILSFILVIIHTIQFLRHAAMFAEID